MLHLSHDRETRIEFRTLADYVEIMMTLGRAGIDISDLKLKPDGNISYPLTDEIGLLCAEDSEYSVFLLGNYLQVCRIFLEDTKVVLVAHEDFLVRESFSLWLRRNLSIDDFPYVERLSQDNYSRVRAWQKWHCLI